jgi:hypothetical protein
MYQIKSEQLEGKWYIILSNFPMWLKGDKTNPAFHYRIATKGQITGLSDEVSYLKKGRTKYIRGFDRPGTDINSFVWRGSGLLGLLSSKWSVLCIDDKEQWAVIKFEKTLFTPKGYDVISRNGKVSGATLEEIQQKLKELDVTDPLTPIVQTPQ